MLFKKLFNILRKSKQTNKADEAEIEAVWQKAAIVKEVDANIFRKDICGAWIRKDKLGDKASEFGWEIGYIKPLNKGGEDSLANKQALHWENHLIKEDYYPVFMSIITSVSNLETKNINKSKMVDVGGK